MPAIERGYRSYRQTLFETGYEKRKHRQCKTTCSTSSSNRVNAMHKTRKSIGPAIIWVMTAIALAGPVGSGAAAAPHPVAVAFDPCPLPLPMEAHGAAALWADGRHRDTIDARFGLMLPARVPLPPAADTGFGCPIARTTT
jgi:hypothetical protein